MKSEIKKILNDNLYYTYKTNCLLDDVIDKILQLFSDGMDSVKDELIYNMETQEQRSHKAAENRVNYYIKIIKEYKNE